MRSLHPDLAAEFKKSTLRVGLFCEILYATPVRFWNGIGNKTWDSKTWTGTGVFGGITAVQERGGALAGSVALSLSGVPSELVSLALSDTAQGCKATVWFAAFDSNWGVIGEPVRMVRGKTDVCKILLGGKTSTISVTVITPMTGLKRVRNFLWTDAEQQRRFPGDKFFEYGASMAERPLYWGVQGQAALAPKYGGEAPDDGSSDYL